MKTAKVKTILIPTDFSDQANNAINHGISLAQKINAQILLLHAFHFNVMIDMNGQLMGTENIALEIEQVNAEKLKSCLELLRKQFPSLQIDALQSMGLLVDVIQEMCDKKPIDFIVMGTKGTSGIEEYILGTNTALVVESVKCPVLVVPDNCFEHGFKKIAYATDFLFEDVENIQQVAEIAKLYNASLQVVHITRNSVDEKYVQKWFLDICVEKCHYNNLAFINISLKQNTLSTLNKWIDQEGIDLVVLNATGKNFIKKIFSGSLTQKMAYHTHIPFLAYHKNLGDD